MMNDPTTELPARDPWPTTPSEAFVNSHEAEEVAEDVAMAEDASEEQQWERPVASTTPARINATVAKQIDARIDVMIDRINSYRTLLAKYGIDETRQYAGVKATLQTSLTHLDNAETELRAAKARTASVQELLESL